MKKKITSKLTLGKRSVATLSEETMASLEGGYTRLSVDWTCFSANCGDGGGGGGGGGFTTCTGSGSPSCR